jgi:hypothetical protein
MMKFMLQLIISQQNNTQESKEFAYVGGSSCHFPAAMTTDA